jgi:plasmid stability protein
VAQLVVRNIETEVRARLQRRAKRHGRSMEEEVRDILRDATATEDKTPLEGLGSEIASLFSKVGLTEDITELRGFQVKPASLRR